MHDFSEIIYRVFDVGDGTFAELVLNRPHAANAMSPSMLRELNKALIDISKTQHRLLLISGSGRNFCAGADLRWMKESGAMGQAQNVVEAKLLAKFFSHLCALPMPVVALVNGAAFGGAVGLVACCDYALASTTARFCLSEVRIGLVPALILPYLLHKMPRTFLTRAGLTGEVFSAEEALQYGLVTKVIPCDDLKKELPAEINTLLQCAPQAQASFKKLLADIRPQREKKHEDAAITCLAAARSSEEAKAGIAAFFAKQDPPWQQQLDANWTETFYSS